MKKALLFEQHFEKASGSEKVDGQGSPLATVY